MRREFTFGGQLSRSQLNSGSRTPFRLVPGITGNPVWRFRTRGWSMAPTLEPAPTCGGSAGEEIQESSFHA